MVGLTSPGNVAFVEGLGCYDHVLTYDDIALLPDGPAALVDMSGNAAVVRAVHERYGDDLTHSMVVGLTHWEDRVGSTDALPGPEQTFFFAPSQIEKRRGDWGSGVVESKLAEAWGPFIHKAADWVSVEHSSGPDAVADVYVETLEGNTQPRRRQSPPPLIGRTRMAGTSSRPFSCVIRPLSADRCPDRQNGPPGGSSPGNSWPGRLAHRAMTPRLYEPVVEFATTCHVSASSG